ncbi:hypothetical protein [Mycobacteroides salmoniphilum]|uniref:Uncharacterized protein n=1 Tax=Mycobacteroides salmoniphilum TaxID=404941 RepID=A0A4R8SUX0_9MYCO|nr:hypothetical protein [Mycobacteroides salmoniphilum]TEA06107.1 hypothetical protein CCUG60884_01244 [Mycobacteroides salmoniphilum]
MTWPTGGANDDGHEHGPDDPLSQPLNVTQAMMMGFGQHPVNPLLKPNGALDGDLGRLNQLNNENKDSRLPQQHKVDLAHVLKYKDGLNGISGANDKVAEHVEDWDTGAALLKEALDHLDGLAQNKYGLKGNVVEMIINKVNLMKQSIAPTMVAAKRMRIIATMFANDIGQTKAWFVDQNLQYVADNGTDEQKSVLDQMAHQAVRDAYNPPIEEISSNHPAIPSAPPDVDPTPAGTPTPMASGPGPGGKTPQGLKLNGLGDPLSDFRDTKDPRDNPNQNQNQNQNQGVDPSSALDGASNAAKEAGDAASKAAEGAGGAAKDALSELLNGKDGPGQPGGLLGAGAIPVSAAGRNGAAGLGKIGGGSVPRVGTGATPAMPAVKPTEPSVTPTKAGTDTSASRASVSNGSSGGSGSGAPHAGQGGGAAGKVHKTNKALRHDKHGVVDEDAAVVPVVGEEPTAPSVPAKST